MISLQDVTKRYGPRTILYNVSFTVQPGEFLCITGASGAGKSTLLHMLVGAETVSSGSITVDGVDLRVVPPRALQVYRRRIGLIFQDYKLLWDRTVRENIAFPLEVCGVRDEIIQARTEELLTHLHLTQQADVLANALSGGERARTAIARSIAHKPLILLADEPTGSLDPQESLQVLDILRAIHAQGTTIVFATHDEALVDALNTRVIRLEGGRVVRDSVGRYATTGRSNVKTAAAAEREEETEETTDPEEEAEDSDETKEIETSDESAEHDEKSKDADSTAEQPTKKKPAATKRKSGKKTGSKRGNVEISAS